MRGGEKVMKETLCAVLGAVGAGIAWLFGGWDASMITLIVFMAIDYITGLVVAGVFKKSEKSENGGLESRAGWKGLCRKGVTLLIVFVAVRLDLLIGTNYLRDGVCIAFIVNEVISITENAGLMGVPIPAVITNAISVLKKKQNETEELAEKDKK